MSKAASQRLTNALREQILDSVVTSLFRERKAALVASDDKLAEKLLAWYVEPKNAALMRQLPGEYFHSVSCIRYEAPAVSGRNSDYGAISSSVTLRVPAVLQHGRIELPSSHGMWKEIRASDAEAESINNDTRALREKVNGLLNGVTTVKALLTAWPEVEEYLPKFEQATTNLPAVRAEELNSMIAKLKK